MKDNNGLSSLDVEVIRELATCSLNVEEVSRKIYRCRHSVEYHIRKITRITGLDPRKFYDLRELLKMVGER